MSAAAGQAPATCPTAPSTVRGLQDAIRAAAHAADALILAHAYMSQDVVEVADVVGDSYGLAVAAAKADAPTLVMCGVRFMAETCKVLSPQKRVLLPNPIATCPMADQLDPDALEALKSRYPGYATVAYVNTTSELKAHADVCVTSSSAVAICRALPSEKILFVPDPNLGRYVAAQVPEKDFAFFNGGCPIHGRTCVDDVAAARAAHPGALLLVHPECPPAVVEQADFVGSTTQIMDFAERSDACSFIIGTEGAIVEHLQYACPEKRFSLLTTGLSCKNMRATTLMDVYLALVGEGGEEVSLPQEVMEGAGRCIRRMVELGG
jgi:quinolinate synthase